MPATSAILRHCYGVDPGPVGSHKRVSPTERRRSHPTKGGDGTTRILLIAAALLWGAGCKPKSHVAPPPPVVEVAPVTQADVPIYHEWIGGRGESKSPSLPARTGGTAAQNRGGEKYVRKASHFPGGFSNSNNGLGVLLNITEEGRCSTRQRPACDLQATSKEARGRSMGWERVERGRGAGGGGRAGRRNRGRRGGGDRGID